MDQLAGSSRPAERERSKDSTVDILVLGPGAGRGRCGRVRPVGLHPRTGSGAWRRDRLRGGPSKRGWTSDSATYSPRGLRILLPVKEDTDQ